MANFTVSFDDLDALEQQPPDVQDAVLGDLTDAELEVYGQVASKYENHKKMSGIPLVEAPAMPVAPAPAAPAPVVPASAAAAPAPVPAPAVEPAPPASPTTSDFIKSSFKQAGRDIAATPDAIVRALATNVSEPGILSGTDVGLVADIGNAVWQGTGGRAVGAFQDNVGAPIVNALADQFGPAGKFTVKQGLSWLAGQENVEQMDEKELLAAVNAYEEAFGGVTGAAFMQGVTKGVGEAPMFLVRAPKAVSSVVAAATEAIPALKLSGQFVLANPELAALLGKAAAVATPVAKAATAGAIEGAAVGVPLMLATDRNAKPTEAAAEAAKFGALLGGGIAAGMKAAPQVKPAVKTLAVATRDGFKKLSSQVDNVIAATSTVREAQALGIKEVTKPAPGEGARQVKLVEELKRPSYVQFVDSGSGPVARVVELRPSLLSESVLYHDLPISTPAQQTRVGKLLNDKGIAYIGEDAIPSFMSDTDRLRRLTAGEEYVRILTNEGAVDVPASSMTAPQPEARPLALMAEDGAVAVRPVGETYKAPTDPIAVGDDVVVLGRAGSQEVGTAVGAGKDGRIKVETESGTREVQPSQVQHMSAPPEQMNPQHVRDILNIARRGGDTTVGGLAEQLGLAQTDVAALLKAMRERGVLKKGWVAEAGGAQRLSGMGEEVWNRLPPEQRPAFPKQRDTAMPTDPILYDDVSFHNDPTKPYPVVAHPDADIQRLQVMQHMHKGGNERLTPTMLSRGTDLSRVQATEVLMTLEKQGLAVKKGKAYALTNEGRNIARNTLRQVGLDPDMAKFLPESNLIQLAEELSAKAEDRPLNIESFRNGEPVLIERSVNDPDGFVQAEFLGKDPNKEGFARIKYADNTVRSVEMTKVMSTTPPGTSKGPMFMPKAPLPERPNTLPGKVLAKLDAAQRFAEELNAKMTEAAAPALEKILPAHNYVAEDLAHLMRKLDGAKFTASIDTKLNVLRTSLEKSGSKLLSEFDKDIKQLGLGRITPDQMLLKHPEAWLAVRETFQPMFQRAREASRELAALGYVDAEVELARMEGRADQYMANVYRAKYMPRGEWAKMVSRETIDNARKYLMDEAHAAGRRPDVSTIEAKIQEILGADDPLDAFVNYASKNNVSPRTHKHLMRRQEIPEPIRQLLGPEESGTLSLAYSLAQQEALLNSLKALHEIYNVRNVTPDGLQQPLYWSLNRDPARGMTVQVPAEPKKYGPLAGRYVSRQVAEYLTDHATVRDSLGQFMRAVVTTRKVGQVALNPVTWFNATVGNIEASILAGGLDLHPRSVAGLADALREMRAYAKTGDIYKAPLIHEAKRYGVDTEGYLAKEYGYAMDVMTDAVKDAMREGGTVLHVLEKVKNSPKHALHAVGKAYNLIDRSFKLANYMALRRKFLAEAAERGLTGPAAIDYAAGKASFRIAQSFPMPYRPNKLAGAIQDSPLAGVVTNPYFTTASELTRVHLSLPSRVMKEPDLAVRLALLYAGYKGLSALSQHYATSIGLTPEELDYMLESQPDYARQYRQAQVVIPKLYDDPAGRKYPDGSPFKSFDTLDFTGAFDMFRLAQGDPDDSLTSRAIFNFVTMPAQGGVFEGGIRRTADAMGLITDKQFTPKTPRLDQKGGMQLLEQAFEAGYGSAGVNRFRRVKERMDPMRLMTRPLDPVLTPQQAALQTLLPTKTISALSPVQGTMAWGREIQDLTKQMEQMMMSPDYMRASPQEQEAQRNLYMQEIQRLIAKQNRISDLAKKAQQSKQANKTAQAK